MNRGRRTAGLCAQ